MILEVNCPSAGFDDVVLHIETQNVLVSNIAVHTQIFPRSADKRNRLWVGLLRHDVGLFSSPALAGGHCGESNHRHTYHNCFLHCRVSFWFVISIICCSSSAVKLRKRCL